jgi:putative membrane protein
MLRFMVRWLTTAVGIGAAGYLLPGIEIDGPGAAALGALVLGLINVTLRPIVLLLTLPLTVLSLGVFALIVNGAMLALMARWVTGVHVATFWSAVLGSIVISTVGGLLDWGLLRRA